jgi:peptidoglycan/LPS O-acetylase OafA/YrhL
MKQPERVLGWDLLRGLSALCVGIYHLLLWQNVAAIHAFGSYGVYLFFVLSGASLSYTYADRIHTGQFSFRDFLWVRYLRLAPLYVALMLLLLPWKWVKEGATMELLAKYFTNATFLFGFYNPATHAVLVGGWSLGIEAILYLLFPVLIMSLRTRWIGWSVFAALLVFQLLWIQMTIGSPGGYSPNAEAYHQVPAFAAYFMGGCMLGMAQRHGFLKSIPTTVGLTFILAGFGLMLAINPDRQGDELIGWHGLVLAALCFVLVYLASRLRLKSSMAGAAQHLGDATYGVYLLHPVIYFGLTFAVFPRLGIPRPDEWPVSGRLALAMLILAGAFALALLSERYVERPIRQRSKGRAVPSVA